MIAEVQGKRTQEAGQSDNLQLGLGLAHEEIDADGGKHGLGLVQQVERETVEMAVRQLRARVLDGVDDSGQALQSSRC
jgi:hypothetical protein